MDAALSSAISALNSQSQALSTISTNLANTSTSGYKAVSTQFYDMLSQTSGTSSTANTATGGVSNIGRQNVTLGGTITGTSTSTDMAINGNGFFVVTDGSNYYYTRDGEFTADKNGQLYLNGTNYYLLGWSTDTSGNVSSGSSSLSSLQKVDVDNLTSSEAATTSYTLSANLPADGQSEVNTLAYNDASNNSQTLNYAWVNSGTYTDSTTGISYNTYLVSVTSSDSTATLDDGTSSGQSALTYSVMTDSDGNIVSVTGTSGNTIGYTGTELPSSISVTDSSGNVTSVDTSSETWSAVKAVSGYSSTKSLTIYDSTGASEDVPVTWTAAGDGTWIMTMSSPIDSTGSTSGSLADSSGATTSSYSYSVTFNSDGTLKSITPLSEMNGNSLSTAPTDGSGNPKLSVYNWTDSAATSSVSLNMGTTSGSGALTQLNSGESSPVVTINSHNQDGYAFGTLKGVSVDSTGTVRATYSNGQSVAIYKVAVATFANANGLSALSNGVYQESGTSGSANINQAGSNGAGSIEGSALESSTVDSSGEFSNMIVCQQAYSAASQIVTATSKMFDSLMQVRP